MFERLGLALTKRCNLKCIHCLQGDHHTHDLDLKLWKRLIIAAEDLGIRHFSLSGGEPTLYPDLMNGISILKDAKISYSLTTHGLFLNSILRAADLHIPTHVTVSLDGHDQMTHDAIRGRGTFEKTIANIAQLAIGGLQVHVQCTILRPQLYHLRELLDLVSAMGVKRLVLSLPIPTMGLIESGRYPPLHEMAKVKQWVKAQGLNNGLIVGLGLGDLILLTPEDRKTDEQRCRFLNGKDLFVDWKGRLALCCQTSAVGSNQREVIADLNTTSLASAILTREQHMKRMGFRGSKSKAWDNYTASFACLGCCKHLGKLPPCGGPLGTGTT